MHRPIAGDSPRAEQACIDWLLETFDGSSESPQFARAWREAKRDLSPDFFDKVRQVFDVVIKAELET